MIFKKSLIHQKLLDPVKAREMGWGPFKSGDSIFPSFTKMSHSNMKPSRVSSR